jgi:hypothetical protein
MQLNMDRSGQLGIRPATVTCPNAHNVSDNAVYPMIVTSHALEVVPVASSCSVSAVDMSSVHTDGATHQVVESFKSIHMRCRPSARKRSRPRPKKIIVVD